MKISNHRLATIIILGLVSLGQAYPMTVALTKDKATHSCCCSGVTKPCDCHHGKLRCHKDPWATVAPEPCGGKTEEEILSFDGDPFIISRVGFLFHSPEFYSFVEVISYHPSITQLPEAPPPKSLA